MVQVYPLSMTINPASSASFLTKVRAAFHLLGNTSASPVAPGPWPLGSHPQPEPPQVTPEAGNAAWLGPASLASGFPHPPPSPPSPIVFCASQGHPSGGKAPENTLSLLSDVLLIPHGLIFRCFSLSQMIFQASGLNYITLREIGAIS